MPIFMNYGGIKGEDVPGLAGHGWIEIYSFQFGVGRGITSGGSGSADREGSSPSVGEIVVTKPTDASSPRLLQECLGNLEREISIVLTKPGGPRHTLTLSRAVITNITPYHSPGSRERYEKLTIAFGAHDFNGIQNVPIPHALTHFPGI